VRVIGVDPGLTRCGLGVVESGRGRSVSLVAVGVERTPATDPLDRRLLRLSFVFEQWLDAHQPDVLAVEQVFAQHNVRTVTGTAQVAGLALVAAAKRDIPVALHTPSEVKAAVTGSGTAGKEQVQFMVARLLRLSEKPRPADAADALALAICHLWRPGTGRPAPSGMPGRQVRAAEAATPAQRAWAEAERAARRGRAARP
jgi:crossover junction endodeoxyribonuclease RuvC